MNLIVAQMGLPIVCGILWRIIRPSGLDADLTRRVLTTLVFNLLMPALVLSVLWRTDMGMESLKISLYGTGLILLGVASTWLMSRLWRLESRRLGAAMIGIAFPNVTYLGLPVLEQAFGPSIRSIVIQIDLFAVTPTILVLGVIIGRRYGDASHRGGESILRSLLLNPPLWAAGLAVFLSIEQAPMPGWLDSTLDKLASAVIPLMLLSLGLGLHWKSWRWANLPLSLAVLAMRLAIVPWVGLVFAQGLGFSGQKLAALVMEAGMPSMLMGVLYCDRYRLDTAFYAMMVALTTLVGLFTLPVWQHRIAG